MNIMNKLEQEKIVVSQLIDVCEDGRNFYKTAADKIKNDDLKKLFRKNVNVRESIILDLESYIQQKGDFVKPEGTLGGKTINFFSELAAFVSPDTDQTLVNRLEEAEDRSLEEFRKAIDMDITPDLKNRIVSFVNDLQRSHDRMKTMKEIMKAA